jgi:hypothetical protein
VFEDPDMYLLAKSGNSPYTSNRGFYSKISGNLSHLNDGKYGFGMPTDTSAIEAHNQSQDIEGFDDILDDLDKGFKQRDGKTKLKWRT